MKKSEQNNKNLLDKNKLIEWLFTIILFFYPMRKAFTGFDLMDAGYSLGNYKYFDNLHQGWKLATYLANVIGVCLSKLPFGDTWVGMNLYTSALIGFTAAFVYRFFVKRTGGKLRYNVAIMFIAEIFGLSLCWSPSVILYQNLGYIFMSFAVLALYKAITEDKVILYIIAGIILGLAVIVRMPNITYMAFILTLWYNCLISDKNANENSVRNTDNSYNLFMILTKKTSFCITGYLLGVIIPLIFISVRYGVNAYPNMISWLFGMTENATDYKSTSMITAMFSDYASYSIWLLLFAVYMCIGIVTAKLLKGILDNSIFEKLFLVLYTIGFAVIIRFCYGRGMFDFDYNTYFSMYKWVTVYLLIVILMCVYCIFSKQIDNDVKLWSVFLLVIIFITPLGSNNGLYPIVNNLYIVAPVSAYLLILLCTKALESIFFINNNCAGYVLRVTVGAVIFCTVVQSVLFGVIFVFHDGEVTSENKYKIASDYIPALKRLSTDADRKNDLEELAKYIFDNGLENEKVILYGNIPAVAYSLDLEPAIYTTWVELDSNSLELLKEQLSELEKDKELPMIILGNHEVDYIEAEYTQNGNKKYAYDKLEAIRNFMKNNGYAKAFSNDMFTVLY